MINKTTGKAVYRPALRLKLKTEINKTTVFTKNSIWGSKRA
jgi:hypothetical protein